MMAQILWLSVAKKHGNNVLVTAGTIQTVVCAPIVYLEATVNGDLTGRQTEWVQISGTPTVDIITVSPTQAYYLAGENPGSDKVFRFYIDRNTQLEEYRDVQIKTTPSSKMHIIENGFVTNNVLPDPYTQVLPFEISGDFAFTITPFNSEGRLLDINDTFVSWRLPELFYHPSNNAIDIYRKGFKGTLLQLFSGSAWQNIGYFTLPEIRLYPLNPNDRLRIVSVFDIPGKGLIAITNPWEDITGSGGSLILGKEVIAPIESGIINHDITRTALVYQLDMQNYTDSVTVIEQGIVNNAINTNKIVYTLDIQDYTETAPIIESGIINNVVTFTRLSGGSIGG